MQRQTVVTDSFSGKQLLLLSGMQGGVEKYQMQLAN